jgi:hypothetical protein
LERGAMGYTAYVCTYVHSYSWSWSGRWNQEEMVLEDGSFSNSVWNTNIDSGFREAEK